MSESLIATEKVSVRFGGLWAVQNVDLRVGRDEILGIIGPNGAGKSTLLNVLTGLQRPTNGELHVGAERVVAPQAWRMAKLGIARSFQTIRLLDDLSVLENVLIGGHLYAEKRLFHIAGRTFHWKKSEQQLVQFAQEVLEWLGVQAKQQESIKTLSLQERRRVEIARALMTRPKVLLLDEPGAGFSPQESMALCELINSIRNRGISVVLVEHNMKVVMSLADRMIVLDHGQKIAEGTPEEISRNETVIRAYLGGEVHA